MMPGEPPFLHLSIEGNGGRASCDGRKLSPDLTIDSPECAGMAVCPSCWALAEHYRREESYANRTRKPTSRP